MARSEAQRQKIHWCNECRAVIAIGEQAGLTPRCPSCRSEVRYLTTDVRPVFARERRFLEFFGHEQLDDTVVWKSGKSQYYYIDGQSITLPKAECVRQDLSAITAFVNENNHYDALDQQLIQDYQRQFQISRRRRLALEDEAFQFINQTIRRFSRRQVLVSFSGGKDSTVISSLVRRALGDANVLHVFGDTTLEDENTYEYVHKFREANPLIPFFESRADHDFHKLVDEIGPPSRAIRWCCTIFKAGPINDVLQSFGDQQALAFYGIRHGESHRRSQYDRVTWDDSTGLKIGQQATASPIIHWTEFDVWNYIISHGLQFNKSYRLGFSRVGCWLCPMNSRWSEILVGIFFPEDALRWHAQLVDFAQRIGKPDPEEYVDQRGWTKRTGGAGLPNRFTGLETRPCGDMTNAVQIEIERPVDVKLEEYLKPLGRINRERSRPALGEIYLEGRPNQDWDALIVQAPENSTVLRFTVINPKQNMRRLTWHFSKQATKFQTCIQCTACAAVCPQGAITIKPDLQLYEIDQDACIGCLECVTHFGARGCLVADALHATE